MSDTQHVVKELWTWIGVDHLGNEGVICRETSTGVREPFLADTLALLQESSFEARLLSEHLRLTLKPARFVREDDATERNDQAHEQ